jgi:hypothetical protein
MAVFGAALLVIPAARLRPAFAWGAVGAVLAFNLWGNLETALRNPPGITTQFDAVTQIDHRADSELIEFLRSQGEQRGYTNYWVAYPLAFLSTEEAVFVPRLPYHPDFRYTARDDRYPPYDGIVGESDRVAYITARFPALDERLRDGLGDLGITFRERAIGDYRVFFDLSRPVSPEALGFPAETAP